MPGCWPLHSPLTPLQLLLLPPPEKAPCIAGATGEYMAEGELSGDSALLGFTRSGSGSSNACDKDVEVADLSWFVGETGCDHGLSSLCVDKTQIAPVR